MTFKAYHYLSRFILLLGFFSLCFSANAQDLIERTKQNITLQVTDPIKPIGKQIHSYRWPKSGVSLFELHKSKKSNDYSEFTDEAIYLTLDRKKLSSSFKSNQDVIRFSVPVSSTASFDLILESVEILAPEYKMETSDGRVIYPDRSKFKFYRGIIADDPNSIATVTIIGDKVRALISDDRGNYILGELPKDKGVFTLYNDKTLKKNLGEFCQVSDSDLPPSIVQDQKKVSTDKSTISPCVPIYVEADYKMYQDHGSSATNVEAFIASLLNEVATIYTNESITISLSSTYVWTSNDSYNFNDLFSAIQQFANLRMDNYDGRLAHLISGEGSQGGLGWVDVLYSKYRSLCLYDCPGQTGETYEGWAFECGDAGPYSQYDPSCLGTTTVQEDGPYSVSTGMSTSVIVYPTFSWEVEVFAHEMGHNFGSPHTHACAWGPNNNQALDNCYYTEGSCGYGPDPGAQGGTIMSYCHLNQYTSPPPPNLPNPGIDLANGFGTEPGDLIRSRYNATPPEGITLECQNSSIPGCTDQNAYNYDSNATEDDGSCQTCNDGMMNGDETGVDCGGTMYPNCPVCPCLEVFASNYNLPGPCVYDCTTNTTNTIDGTNVNASIITSQSSLQTMGTVIADPSSPIIWRANGSVELNPNFSIELNSSVTIDVGECEDN